jgi:hypothetical protein
MNYVERVKKAAASKEEFKRFVQTKEAPAEGKAYFNEDLLPTPPSKSKSVGLIDSDCSFLRRPANMGCASFLRVLLDANVLPWFLQPRSDADLHRFGMVHALSAIAREYMLIVQ